MPDRQPEDDGVRVTARPSRGGVARAALLLLAALAVAGVVGWRVAERRARSGDGAAARDASVDPPETASTPVASPAADAPGATVARAAARDGEDTSRTLADYVLPGEAPRMADVIRALHARGIRSGLGAFPPPGTRPPLRGLVVPDGFALPPGYVRHHQATDDGQTIAPILMFSPDIDSIEVRGVRVAIPPDRVVPPELAPPGMPLRWVRIPPPRDGGPSP